MARSEQEPKTLIGQLRQDLRAIDMNIMMLENALDGRNGSSVDSDYRPTTRIWVAELNGMRNHTRYLLGEMTFEEMMEDANQRTRDRYVEALGTGKMVKSAAQHTIEAYARHMSRVGDLETDMEGVRF